MTAPAASTRLLMVSSFYDSHLGGLEVVAVRLANGLASRGFEVSWLATDATPPPCGGPVKAIPISGSNWAERLFGVPVPLLGPAACRRLFQAVREADVILVHDALYVTSLVAAFAAKIYAKPLVVLQHVGAIPYRSRLLRGAVDLANRWVARPLLASAAQVIFISQTVREFFGDLAFGAPPQIVFNGVDTQTFAPAPDQAAARLRFELPSDQPVALFVGRFVEKKGLHLIRAAARARPQMTWALAGGGAIDPSAWGLSNVRTFAGLSGASLAALYRASDVFVLPSRGEGFPLVIQEALACGRPVVCGAETRTADAAAALWMDGVDLSGDDEADLAHLLSAVDAALARPDETGARAAFAKARYSWALAADRYADLLRGALVRKARGDAVLETPHPDRNAWVR